MANMEDALQGTFPLLLEGTHLLVRRYFAASIGEVSQSTIEHYIENQG